MYWTGIGRESWAIRWEDASHRIFIYVLVPHHLVLRRHPDRFPVRLFCKLAPSATYYIFADIILLRFKYLYLVYQTYFENILWLQARIIMYKVGTYNDISYKLLIIIFSTVLYIANATFIRRCDFISLEFIMYDLVLVDLSLCCRAYYIVYFVFWWDLKRLILNSQNNLKHSLLLDFFIVLVRTYTTSVTW